MGRLHRRRLLPGRRLARPGRPAPQFSPDPPALELTEEESAPKSEPSGDSTEFAALSVPGNATASPPVNADAATAELPSVHPVEEPDGEGVAPARMEFICPCGAKLIATRATYDKHSRCAMCQTELLLNLVYDPEQGSHEIVPFRVDPNSPL